LSTHDSVDVSTEEKSAPIAENATNRIVVSRNTANTASPVEESTHHGLIGRCGSRASGSVDMDGPDRAGAWRPEITPIIL
jgi:hypothetical protein